MDNELEQIREQNRWKPEQKEEEQEKPKSSLPKSTVVMMTITALFFDGLQAGLTLFGIGLIASPFISVFAGLVFFLWFMLHGISLVTPKRFLAMGGGWLTELIPAVDALPAWTAAVWYTISTTKVLETAQKLPGGRVAGMVVGSKISSVNTARATAIEDAKTGLSTQSANRGNVLYMGAKNPQTTQNQNIQRKVTDSRQNMNQWRETNKQWEEMKHKEFIEKYGGQEKWDNDKAESARQLGQHSEQEKKDNERYQQSKKDWGIDKAA